MDLTTAKAVKLIERLGSCRIANFPEDAAGRLAMARTLMEAAPELGWATLTVEKLRRECQFSPTDAEIFKAADAIRPPRVEIPPAAHRPIEENVGQRCPLGICDGSGYIPVEVRGVSAVKRCGCLPAAPPEPERKPAGSLRPVRDAAKLAAGDREE